METISDTRIDIKYSRRPKILIIAEMITAINKISGGNEKYITEVILHKSLNEHNKVVRKNKEISNNVETKITSNSIIITITTITLTNVKNTVSTTISVEKQSNSNLTNVHLEHNVIPKTFVFNIH